MYGYREMLEARERAAGIRQKLGQAAPPFLMHEILARVFPEITVAREALPATVRVVTAVVSGRAHIIARRGLSPADEQVALAMGLAQHLWDLREHDEADRCAMQFDPIGQVRAAVFADELLAPFDVIDGLLPRGIASIEARAHVERIAKKLRVPRGFLSQRIRDLLLFRASSRYATMR